MVSTTLMAGLLKKEHKGWILKEHSKISLFLTSTGLLQDPHENSMSELDFNSLQLSSHMSVFVKGIEPTISNCHKARKSIQSQRVQISRRSL